MPDTTRRVAVTLVAATDEDAHQVMAGVLDAVRNALPALAIDYATNSVFDLSEEEPEPAVYLVVDDPGIVGSGSLVGIYTGNAERADEHARNIGGLVVALPIEADHRLNEVGRDV